MVEAPNKRLDRARAELDTYGRVGKQTASDLILALFEAERQIAELRAERDFEQSSRLTSEAQLGTRIGNLERELAAARAENARLRALPLKDEVERVLRKAHDETMSEAGAALLDKSVDGRIKANWLGGKANGLATALDILSRLRAGEQEGWQQCGWAYQDKQWDEGRWHVCGMDSTPRERNGRLVQPIYVAASPSVSDGGRRPWLS